MIPSCIEGDLASLPVRVNTTWASLPRSEDNHRTSVMKEVLDGILHQLCLNELFHTPSTLTPDKMLKGGLVFWNPTTTPSPTRLVADGVWGSRLDAVECLWMLGLVFACAGYIPPEADLQPVNGKHPFIPFTQETIWVHHKSIAGNLLKSYRTPKGRSIPSITELAMEFRSIGFQHAFHELESGSEGSHQEGGAGTELGLEVDGVPNVTPLTRDWHREHAHMTGVDNLSSTAESALSYYSYRMHEFRERRLGDVKVCQPLYIPLAWADILSGGVAYHGN